jgi:uncharacterized protein (TIGR03067 family)
MRKAFFALALALPACGPTPTASGQPKPGDAEAKELKRLEGVWAEEPPKGDGRANALFFKGGKLGWRSTRYRGGEPLIGHSKVYDVRLVPSARPKEITLTRGEGDSKETRLGIYEVAGHTLKLVLGDEKARPKKMDDNSALVLTLKRKK